MGGLNEGGGPFVHREGNGEWEGAEGRRRRESVARSEGSRRCVWTTLARENDQ
jgi:hypothetical protein